MAQRNRLALPAFAALVALMSVQAPVTRVDAQNGCTHEALFGLYSLARLQTVRLNVVLPPDPTNPPDSCHVAIGFLTTGNERFRDSAGVPIVVEQDLRAGQFAYVELRAADAFRDSQRSRVPFRATAIFTRQKAPGVINDPCGAVIPTVEISDNLTGRSQVVSYPIEIVKTM